MKKPRFMIFGLSFAIALFISGCLVKEEIPETNLPVPPTYTPTHSSTSTHLPIPSTPQASDTSQWDISIQTVESVPSIAEAQLPTTTPTQPSQPEPVLLQAEDCLDEAAFYADVTIPDGTRLEAGETFTKTWQVRNSGTCTWGDGYALVFASGDMMSGALTNPISEVPPGEIVNVSVELVAPARGGEHTGNWTFQNSHGNRFGVGSGNTGQLWVQIHVEWSTASNNTPADQQPLAPSLGSSNCSASEDSGIEMQILSLINAARAEQGLAELTISTALSQASLRHSLDMACQDFVDHNGSDGSNWYDRATNQGYANANSARENIYVGDPAFGGTAEGAFSWWMNSQVHRDNILSTVVSEIGIGYVYNPNSTYGGYYTVLFARP